MKKVIKLNNETYVDLEKLIEGGMVILANSGGGKSYLIRRIAEQAVENVQVIIIDPEGEFASLRERFDFILAGKNADVPAEPRSAALLAKKLLEINKSAVIDLYELHPQERQRFVKLFCDALVNAPKELYHPVLIILDEAHEYVPEGKPSEATWAVESLASKGRKRGQRLILASQRVAKISKNVTAEANNKLIGRASQDIDMKRAGDELGFGKDRLKELRQLKPGEFFAFGPAISDDIVKLKVGEVQTAHAKVGYTGVGKVPPASEAIKKILGELKDLPQEAEKEMKTIQEFKQQISQLKHDLKKEQDRKVNMGKTVVDLDWTESEVKKSIAKRDKEWEKIVKEWQNFAVKLYKTLRNDTDILNRDLASLINQEPAKTKPDDEMTLSNTQLVVINPTITRYQNISDLSNKVKPTTDNEPITFNTPSNLFGKCARAIYSFTVQDMNRVWSKTQVAVATGYSQNSGGFNNAISELSAAGIITRENSGIRCIKQEELYIDVDTSLEKWSAKLGACSRAIWNFMLTAYENDPETVFSKEDLANNTGYSATSGGFNNSLSNLSALGLIERMSGGMIRINPEILNL